MVTQFDEKGKIFTNVISKDAVPSTIQTLTHRMHGFVHVHQGERIKDELSRPEGFIAVTDAMVFDEQGKVIYRTNFLVVNRAHIVWLLPDEDLVGNSDSGEN